MREIIWSTKDGREVKVVVGVVELNHTNHGEVYQIEYMVPPPEVFLAGKKLPYFINENKNQEFLKMGYSHTCGPLAIHKDKMVEIMTAQEADEKGHIGYQVQQKKREEGYVAAVKHGKNRKRIEEIAACGEKTE